MSFAEYREREAYHEYKQAFELQKIRILLAQNAEKGTKLSEIFSIPLYDTEQESKPTLDLNDYQCPDLFEMFPDLKN